MHVLWLPLPLTLCAVSAVHCGLGTSVKGIEVSIASALIVIVVASGVVVYIRVVLIVRTRSYVSTPVSYIMEPLPTGGTFTPSPWGAQ